MSKSQRLWIFHEIGSPITSGDFGIWFPVLACGRIIGLGLVLSVLWLLAGPRLTFGQVWSIEPSVRLGAQYDDNIRLAVESPDEVFGTELSGAFDVNRVTETMELRWRAQWDAIEYYGNDNNLENDNNQIVDLSSVYRTELDLWKLKGSYRRDSLLRIEESALDLEGNTILPGEDIDVGLVQTSVQRNRLDVNPSWQSNLTERTRIGLAYRFNYVFHEDVAGANVADFREHKVWGEIFNDLTERSRIGVALEALRFDVSDEDQDTDSYAVWTSIDHAFSENTRAGVSLGIRQTLLESAGGDDNDTKLLARVHASQKTQWGRFDAVLERDVVPSSSGDLVQTDQLLFRMNKKISPRLGLSFRLRLFRNETFQAGNTENDRYFLSIRPRLRWSLTQQLSLDASYRYRRQKRDRDPDSAESNAFFVSVNYMWPVSGIPRK